MSTHKVAIKYGATSHVPLVDEDGDLIGQHAGITLVRRLLRVFPDSVVIGPAARRCNGFDMVPLEFIDGDRTVVINMDVIDSMSVWAILRESCDDPKIMNFEWVNASEYRHVVQQASLALSFALFPTFANSERTAGEVREMVRSWTVKSLGDEAQLAWVNLGVRLERRQQRHEPETPVVLYPAIYLHDRKQPKVFLDVIERVRKRTPIQVEMRLHESNLVSATAMRLSGKRWMWVGPLTATREGYWDALSHTTAFLATAKEESYGLQYIEAMVAGAVGIFPNRDWVYPILPEGYPFIYDTLDQAEEMLHRAVTEPAACLAEIDTKIGNSLAEWLRGTHDDENFETAVAARVAEWFPN